VPGDEFDTSEDSTDPVDSLMVVDNIEGDRYSNRFDARGGGNRRRIPPRRWKGK
jgi:hypothetical protein